jgi:hypothetical protein
MSHRSFPVGLFEPFFLKNKSALFETVNKPSKRLFERRGLNGNEGVEKIKTDRFNFFHNGPWDE